jgi:hypothetical protein
MDDETVRKIAAEVVRLLPNYTWVLLLVQAAILAVAAGAGAFLGEYLKSRGKNLATRADFESLQAQLRDQTELVETIKSEVSQRDWAQREWTNIRRIKLEALMDKMHECDVYLTRKIHNALDGEVTSPERDCVDEVAALGDLYFEELKHEISIFTMVCRQQVMLIGELWTNLKNSPHDDQTARQNALDNFESHSRYRDFLVARDALTAAARSLLERIMNVDERSRDKR